MKWVVWFSGCSGSVNKKAHGLICLEDVSLLDIYCGFGL